MENLDSTLIVFAVLVAVAVAAVSFQPADPLEKWNRLVKSYGTSQQPQEVQFTGQSVAFGGLGSPGAFSARPGKHALRLHGLCF